MLMKKAFLFIITILFYNYSSFAQVTPQPSPGAFTAQTVGITKLEMEYSRPSARGRKIFGGLLPYGKLWRTGANAPTRFFCSTDVKINEQVLPAGNYAILSYPREKEWFIVFSSDLEATEDTYFPDYDAIRVNVATQNVNFTESFTIDFSNITDSSANLNFYWEQTLATIQIVVSNERTIIDEVELRKMESAGTFLQAAEYMVNHNMDFNKALEYIENSISLVETFRNTWIKSVILYKLKRYPESLKFAILAREKGQTDTVYEFFKDAIDQTITELENRPLSNQK